MIRVVKMLLAEHACIRLANDSIVIKISPSTLFEGIVQACDQDGQDTTHR